MRREFDLGLTASARALGGVEHQVAGDENRGTLGRASAHQCPQPGQQHDDRERLAHVVVGAHVEPFGLVELAVLGGQHHDRRGDRPRSEFAVHEFGHLLTLHAEEVPPGGDPDSCPTYHTGEGCALTGSTFAGFVERFWPPTMVDEIDRVQEDGNWDAIDTFYNENEDSFVTAYATTNPAEDLAETFGVFVIYDRPEGTSVADEKVEFLWGDPDLVALRTGIRARGDFR